MVKIQIDLTDKEDKIVEIHKAKNRIQTKEETIKDMIKSFSECNHEFERLEKKPYTKLSVYDADKKFIKIVERCKKCAFVRTDDIEL